MPRWVYNITFDRNIELLETEEVRKFIGTYKPEHYLLDRKNPIAMGPMDLQSYLFEHKRQQWEAIEKCKTSHIRMFLKEFEKLTGRNMNYLKNIKWKMQIML